jgi:gamma-glutamyl hydrolase
MLAVIASGNTSLLQKFDAEDYASQLYLTEEGEESHFFRSVPKKVVKSLQEEPLAMENHANGVYYRSFKENKKLQEFFKVLSLSIDRGDRVYVSTMEAREYPITATQWHPEKNTFEWAARLRIPHTREAIDVTSAVANYLVEEARKNTHQPANVLEEDRLLIYNYCPQFTGKHHHEGEEMDFDECYFFPKWEARHANVASQ